MIQSYGDSEGNDEIIKYTGGLVEESSELIKVYFLKKLK